MEGTWVRMRATLLPPNAAEIHSVKKPEGLGDTLLLRSGHNRTINTSKDTRVRSKVTELRCSVFVRRICLGTAEL